ncbi:MAG: thioredoxin domain-containing protein [Magnetococcus sp. XQGC-1]
MRQPPFFPEAWTLLLLAILVALLSAPPAWGENRLATSASPYLRHHANDPIHWQPWGEEALALARQQDKPIFLSIGYLACHWCRVMGGESFQEPEVARLLNDHYIPILVDREERPDLDAYYLRVATAMNGLAGWPQHLFLTPDLLPLYAGNYYPPRPRDGLPGFISILQGLHQAWSGERAKLLSREGEIRAQLLALTRQTAASNEREADVDLRLRATALLLERGDSLDGGFQEEPKFPHAVALSLLLREGVRQADSRLAAHVYTTLDRMAAGGIRDQLGGLFHRYAVDRAWQRPHYEVMLADNLLLARLYLEAYQISRLPRYAWVARGVLDGLLERFTLADGGLASSLAADSLESSGASQDGAYYTWRVAEVKNIIGAQQFQAWHQVFALGDDGERGGALRLRDHAQPLEGVHRRFADPLRQLLAVRQQRSPPDRDDKAITSWNGLAVGTLALAARVLDEPRYHASALAILDPLLRRFRQGGRLSHFRLDGQFAGEEFLDDYAFLLQALMDLYETDFRQEHLQNGWQVAQTLLARFRREGGGMLSLTPVAEAGPIPAQTLILDQQEIPSGNALAWSGLARLNMWRADPCLTWELAQVVRQLPEVVGHSPHLAGELLRVVDYAPLLAREVIIVGNPQEPGVATLLQVVRRRMGVGEGVAVIESTALSPEWPSLAGRPQWDGKPTAYLCRGGLCLPPVTDAAALQELLAQ